MTLRADVESLVKKKKAKTYGHMLGMMHMPPEPAENLTPVAAKSLRKEVELALKGGEGSGNSGPNANHPKRDATPESIMEHMKNSAGEGLSHEEWGGEHQDIIPQSAVREYTKAHMAANGLNADKTDAHQVVENEGDLPWQHKIERPNGKFGREHGGGYWEGTRSEEAPEPYLRHSDLSSKHYEKLAQVLNNHVRDAQGM